MAKSPFRLNQEERQLLLKHYDFYRALDSGVRSPTTRAQEHFVAVCRLKAAAETTHERAYLNFKKLMSMTTMLEKQVVGLGFALEVRPKIDRPHEKKTPLAPKAPPSANSYYDWTTIDEYGEGVPRPGWFSDEGWKRMRGQYLSNSE